MSLPYLRPLGKVVPCEYDQSVSFYEFLNRLYQAIDTELIPKINEVEEEMQDAIRRRLPEVEAELLKLKRDIGNTAALKTEDKATLVAAVNEVYDIIVALRSDYDDFKRKTATNVRDMVEEYGGTYREGLTVADFKSNKTLYTGAGTLSTERGDIPELAARIETSAAAADTRLAALEAWKENVRAELTNFEAWRIEISAWKQTTENALSAAQMEISNTKDRVSALEAGTRTVLYRNFMGTTLDIGSYLEEEDITTWADLLGKTLTIGIIFASSSTEANAVPTLSGTKLGTINIAKTSALSSLTNKSLTIHITPTATEEGVIVIDQTAHFNSSISALYGGLAPTTIDAEDAISMVLNLTGFNAATTGQIYLNLK